MLEIYDDVEYCFSASTVEETIDRLSTISHPFARYALENMIKCDPFALKVIHLNSVHFYLLLKNLMNFLLLLLLKYRLFMLLLIMHQPLD